MIYRNPKSPPSWLRTESLQKPGLPLTPPPPPVMQIPPPTPPTLQDLGLSSYMEIDSQLLDAPKKKQQPGGINMSQFMNAVGGNSGNFQGGMNMNQLNSMNMAMSGMRGMVPGMMPGMMGWGGMAGMMPGMMGMMPGMAQMVPWMSGGAMGGMNGMMPMNNMNLQKRNPNFRGNFSRGNFKPGTFFENGNLNGNGESELSSSPASMSEVAGQGFVNGFTGEISVYPQPGSRPIPLTSPYSSYSYGGYTASGFPLPNEGNPSSTPAPPYDPKAGGEAGGEAGGAAEGG